jgi:hypothetical protein
MGGELLVTKTLRGRFFGVPGRLVRSGRRLGLRLPGRWQWADQFMRALQALRAVPVVASVRA